MYYFKVIDNDVYKFKVNYDLASVQKYLYFLAIDLGKTVHSNYVTEKPHKNADKIYKTYNVKYFGKSKDFKPLFEVDCEEVVRPSLYKLIEKIINGDNKALEELYDYKVEKNGNKRDVNFYYSIFRDLFSFEFIDKMNLEMYNEARKFMELEQIEYNRGKER
ncbi:unknown [Clostridium sp. CAG:609]|nr:unknown [Clostridium sp. CAG:609]